MGAIEGVSITTMIYAWTVTFNRELIDTGFLGVGFPLLLAYFHFHFLSSFSGKWDNKFKPAR